MAGHRGSQWTAEEDRRLLDLIRMNKSWVLISAALSRSVKSVRDRARHLERQAKMEAAGLDAEGTYPARSDLGRRAAPTESRAAGIAMYCR